MTEEEQKLQDYLDQKMRYFHVRPKPDDCAHEFQGWREFADGNGGESFCSKCGMGAMAYSLRCGL